MCIRDSRPAERVETASEALALSVGERAGIDFGYMQQLTGKDKDCLLYTSIRAILVGPFPARHKLKICLTTGAASSSMMKFSSSSMR